MGAGEGRYGWLGGGADWREGVRERERERHTHTHTHTHTYTYTLHTLSLQFTIGWCNISKRNNKLA